MAGKEARIVVHARPEHWALPGSGIGELWPHFEIHGVSEGDAPHIVEALDSNADKHLGQIAEVVSPSGLPASIENVMFKRKAEFVDSHSVDKITVRFHISPEWYGKMDRLAQHATEGVPRFANALVDALRKRGYSIKLEPDYFQTQLDDRGVWDTVKTRGDLDFKHVYMLDHGPVFDPKRSNAHAAVEHVDKLSKLFLQHVRRAIAESR